MVLSIFYQFFLLGCTSFGGPAAHLGFFKKHFVDNLKWLSNERYSSMISLSQILPGPGSSQVGFAIGVERAGLLGGIAAFIGFTLPSFLIMVVLALSATQLQDNLTGVIHGLKLFAVVVVADAILSMAKSFCKTTALKLVTFASTLFILISPSIFSQIWLLVIAASMGMLYRFSPIPDSTTSKIGKWHWPALALFVGLFVLSFFGFSDYLYAPFYQAGALVFGGGHVVLPLLQNSVEHLSQESFLTAYAAAQAVPGPMFTIATYLGAVTQPDNVWFGAIIATLAVFLPGLLLMYSCHHSWHALSNLPKFASVTAAINAAVVGLLAAAFYQPIWSSSVTSLWHIAIVVAGFCCMKLFKPPIWMMLIAFASLGLFLS
ncbi:chromate efflux transporter [Pseudoalteromonas aurantia]|uniref:Chromate transporter n=1 Tax=Pseudoalteromonas aurantia 208 TaxID=1314867 RepID=A0ABR9E694_9GAMM|nr:chromate efflux transporter [Pseudoalteromonas aurantia]MBE0366508.1 chromate transporter [Pseudoalteromonas aurantia 208]